MTTTSTSAAYSILKVVVLGHYDSRGGTTAIQVPDLERFTIDRALKQYAELFRMDDDDDTDELLGVALEDLLFIGESHSVVPIDIGIKGVDLEETLGMAVMVDESTMPQCDCTHDAERLIEITRLHPVQFEAVKARDGEPSEAVRFIANATHRSWSDDAFSFILQRLED